MDFRCCDCRSTMVIHPARRSACWFESLRGPTYNVRHPLAHYGLAGQNPNEHHLRRLLYHDDDDDEDEEQPCFLVDSIFLSCNFPVDLACSVFLRFMMLMMMLMILIRLFVSSSFQRLCIVWSYSDSVMAPRMSAAFHSSARREEEAKEGEMANSSQVAESEGFMGTGFSHLWAIPAGVCFAVPVLEFNFLVINEETLVSRKKGQ
jgi:hypothetical protein